MQLARRSGRNLVQFEREAGAAMRLFDIVKSPVLYLRHGEGIDWRELLLKKSQIYFDLSKVTAEAARGRSRSSPPMPQSMRVESTSMRPENLCRSSWCSKRPG